MSEKIPEIGMTSPETLLEAGLEGFPLSIPGNIT
jgi:hypothetical protein